MANIRESLDRVMDLDGAVGAAIVDYQTGMTLGSRGTDLDMELAGAGVMEVVRAERDLIERMSLQEDVEEILVSSDNQYHLIRLFHKNENVFTYVVLDRDKANLALARIDLQEVDGELELS